jgi:hypothetical protein
MRIVQKATRFKSYTLNRSEETRPGCLITNGSEVCSKFLQMQESSRQNHFIFFLGGPFDLLRANWPQNATS